MRTNVASPPVERGVSWLLGVQSANAAGGRAFDKDNDRTYLSSIPFADFGESLDPPSVDVTAHVVEAFGKLGYDRTFEPIQRAYDYIRADQEEDGPWFGRWGVNYIYGVGAVLPALQAIGEDMSQPYVRKAVAWLMRHQNADGGWGEKLRLLRRPVPEGQRPQHRLPDRMGAPGPHRRGRGPFARNAQEASDTCTGPSRPTAHGTSLISPAPASPATASVIDQRSCPTLATLPTRTWTWAPDS